MPSYGGNVRHILIQMLKTNLKKYHKVLLGQSLGEIAAYYSVSPYLLARENGLKDKPQAGQILEIPTARGNVYTVREGDTKSLLCGSEERYEVLNGTTAFYVGMRVIV